ncbi:hypothetical protein [Halobaculum roseum]|uniref:Uncharacterized protein n=1 Tax=Halobaculum roseum TaxID=2175149 RepID=A0ABD5MSF3_9EURY|nr:hypothetical protein [Halobaculum roseum]QZY02096.1 hypothetical protein K6T36_12370 [Halobaculum roseum]
MKYRSEFAYLSATIGAAVLGVVGLLLPWVRKLPAGYTDGQAYYTSEGVWGLEFGMDGLDPALLFLLLGVVGVVIVAGITSLSWQRDLALIGTGAVLLVVFTNRFLTYQSVVRYEVESGLFVLLVSGLLFVLVGAGSLLNEYLMMNRDTDNNPQAE